MAGRNLAGSIACGNAETCPIAAACGPGQAPACNEIDRFHHDKLALCDALEAIADSLPWRVDRFECLRIAAELSPLMRKGHAYEEACVFPAFEGSGQNPERAQSIARLKAEHATDECAAADLSEVLLKIGHGGAVDNPEALGFMLRAFFQSMRRHVAFEREHILPSRPG